MFRVPTITLFSSPRASAVTRGRKKIDSIEMMRDSVSGDQVTKWSGIESKKQSTKN